MSDHNPYGNPVEGAQNGPSEAGAGRGGSDHDGFSQPTSGQYGSGPYDYSQPSGQPGGYRPTYGDPAQVPIQGHGQDPNGQAPLPYGQYGYAQPQQRYGQPGYGQNAYGQVGYPVGLPPVRSDYAPWLRRVGGYLLDSIPSLLASAFLDVGYFRLLSHASTQDLGTSDPAGSTPVLIGGVLMLAALAWQIYNRWIVGGRTGQSLGRRVTHTSLVSELTGQPVGALNAFLRDLLHILDSFFYVGFLWPLWDERRQTFADKIMKTVVVEGAPRT